jgi:hypothetical protein
LELVVKLEKVFEGDKRASDKHGELERVKNDKK